MFCFWFGGACPYFVMNTTVYADCLSSTRRFSFSPALPRGTALEAEQAGAAVAVVVAVVAVAYYRMM